MKLKTLQPITIDQWKAQAERFGKITDKVNHLTFPKIGVNEMPAFIEMEIVQPLSKGFKGRIIYTQQFEETLEFPDENDPTLTTLINITRSHKVVDYYENINRAEADAMFAQLLPIVPSNIAGYLNIQDWCIKQAFLNTIVERNTFGTLQHSDYEFIS